MCEELQEDHKKLSVKRHVQFNADQYGVMDMGKNLNARKDMMGSVSASITLEVDLTVKIDHSMKLSGAQWGAKIKTNIRNC